MGSSPWRLLYAFLLLSITNIHTIQTVSASVLAIDYGTDFTKVSLMKPGVPFDVVLNRDSKRKIASSVAWKGNERLFGADATNIVCPVLWFFIFCLDWRRHVATRELAGGHFPSKANA